MEFPAFFVIGYIVLSNLNRTGIHGLFLLLLWEAHYIYRVFVYPFLLTSPKKPFPLALVGMALVFNTINGAANGLSLIDSSTVSAGTGWIAEPRLWIGTVLFVAGFFMHAHSDRVLRELRRRGNGEYAIPEKGLFRYVSSPNYLGEMIEWAGFAIAAWSPAGVAFVVFTVANLLPRAVSNHRWYKQTFVDYPKERKRLLPFVW
jgi:protein-S-isoprenylcysteine O-methyltransferase Ste14